MILLGQLLLVAVVAYFFVFRLMGRDYDSAVMSSGFVGFMLGTTANAMANMEAIVQRYRAGAEGVSRGADGRRVLHRFHERADHHGVLELLSMISRPMTTSTTPLTRERAWALLTEYTKSESLLKHAMAVEAAVRGYARRFGEDEEFWGITALLHDFDYERYPSLDDHPFRGSEILREQGYPEAMIRAILSHGDHTGVKRESKLEHTLFACDEWPDSSRRRRWCGRRRACSTSRRRRSRSG